MTPDRYLSPFVLQLLGVVLLVGSAIFWAVTGRESVLLMGAAMSLIGLGAYRGAQQALMPPRDPPATEEP